MKKELEQINYISVCEQGKVSTKQIFFFRDFNINSIYFSPANPLACSFRPGSRL